MDNNWLLGALCHSLVMQFVCWYTWWIIIGFLCYSLVMQFVCRCTCVDNNWLLVLFSGYAVCLQVHLRG